MMSNRVLMAASVAFAVVWTILMIGTMSAVQPAQIVIVSVGGAVAGVLWYWGMRWAMRLLRRAMPKG